MATKEGDPVADTKEIWIRTYRVNRKNKDTQLCVFDDSEERSHVICFYPSFQLFSCCSERTRFEEADEVAKNAGWTPKGKWRLETAKERDERQHNQLQEAYEHLKKRLHNDTRHLSNPNGWLRHEAYKEIVKGGMLSVPFILKDLKASLKNESKYPGWWVMDALPEITGVRIKIGGPEVQKEGGFAKVDVKAVSRFWVKWGKAKGWL